MPYDPEPVLTDEAIYKLQKYHLLSDSPEACKWEIEPIWFDMIYPDIKFYDGIIPEVYNQLVFVIYLGFKISTSFEIFYDLVYYDSPPTKEKIMSTVKQHINLVNSNNRHNWACPDSLLADSVMEDMGLIEPVREEVNKLYEAFQRSSVVFQRYFDENHDKNFENLKLVDFVQELLYRRMQKLMSLNRAALQYLLWEFECRAEEDEVQIHESVLLVIF